MVETGEPTSFVEYYGALDRWFETHVFCPEPKRFGIVFHDVTERRRAERAERRQTERLRILAEASRALA